MEALAGVCISFVNAFNPEKLILGGGLGMALPGLVNKVKERIWQGALPSSYEGLKVLTAELLTDAGVIGAASLALKTS
jgi:glucokinase